MMQLNRKKTFTKGIVLLLTVCANADEPLRGDAAVFADAATSMFKVQWGVDVIDQRKLPPDGNPANFVYNGSGVVVYSLDTGLNCDKLQGFANCTVDAAADALVGGGTTCGCDRHGHGTAMAQLISLIALNATLVGVPVLNADGEGSLTRVLWGIQRAGAIHAANFSAETPGVILAPLSSDIIAAENQVEGSVASEINAAIAALLESNILFVASAGNKNVDACAVSPAMAPAALTIAAMVQSGARAQFSNWGPCVDIFAPADAISHGDAYSGTSVSAGYAAGVIANVGGSGLLSGKQIASTVVANASTFKITDRQGVPDRHIFAPRKAPAKETLVNPRVFRKLFLFIGVFVVIAAVGWQLKVFYAGTKTKEMRSASVMRRIRAIRMYGAVV